MSYVGHVGNVGQGWTLHFAPSFYSAQVILLTLTFYREGKLLDKFIVDINYITEEKE